MSPRRSSRARATQPTPTAPTHTNSSTSSISSGRADRTTRSNQKLSSPHRSNPRSQSLDDLDEPAKPPPRRTRSGLEEPKEPPVIAQDEDEEEDVEDEEEVTRCVCGQAEYPGLPGPTLEALKLRTKDSAAATELLTKDIGDIFIQCDVCKVWQHGGCVGITDDGSSVAEYFCEECRKDLHKLATSPDGQRYSHYQPLQDDRSPTASPAPPVRENSARKAKETNSTRLSTETSAKSRRATLNSHKVYDEEEALRIAIEESKKEGTTDVVRKGKRSRSESEENNAPVKRRRTDSSSVSAGEDKAAATLSSSDEALASKGLDHSPKKVRGAAARTQREKEALEQQKNKERQEAASRRNARSERRRGVDDIESDTLEEPPVQRAPSVLSTPPAHNTPLAKLQKKTGRPAGKGRKSGRNQYTKDHDPQSSLQPLDAEDNSRRRTRSRSRSNVRETESPHGNGTYGNGELGKPSKPRNIHPNRGINEMSKMVLYIDEYMDRVEGEHGIKSKSVNSNNGDTNNTAQSSTENGADSKPTPPVPGIPINFDDFAKLDSIADQIAALRTNTAAFHQHFGPLRKQ